MCSLVVEMSESDSDMSIVLNVLADKVDSLEAFSCTRAKLALEPLRRFLRSQKNLQKIEASCRGWCGCAGRSMLPNEDRVGMGFAWIPFVSACIENRSLVEVKGCSCTDTESRMPLNSRTSSLQPKEGTFLSRFAKWRFDDDGSNEMKTR